METQFVSRKAGDTLAFGRDLAALLKAGDVVLLRGPLGAGKSVLARGIGEGIGATSWRGSPTFNLIHEYESLPRLYHIDLYRLTGEDVEDLHLEEAVETGGVLVVEWAERAGSLWNLIAPGTRYLIDLVILGPEEREITVEILSAVEGLAP